MNDIVIRKIDRNVIASPVSPTLARAPQSTAGASLASGLSDVADTFEVFQEEIDTGDAKRADAALTERINDLLYNDQSGYMYQQGGNAIAGRDAVGRAVEDSFNELTEGLSPRARQRADATMRSRYQSALQRINGHAATSRREYLNETADARITASVNAAIYDPTALNQELSIALVEVRDIAAREGWSPEVLAVKEAEVRDQTYTGVINRIAQADPQRALEFARENRGNLSGSALASVESTLIPLAREARGRAAGAAAFEGGGVSSTYLRSIRSAESGGNDAARNPRSSATGRYQFTAGTWADLMRNHPDLGLTAEGRLDPGQQERAIRQFTANNAKSLSASGIQPTNGNLYAAHFLGAGDAKTVLGADDSLMVANLVHPRVVNANPFLRGMSVADFRTWATRKGGGDELGFSVDQGGFDSLLDIADPDERDAAISEYELREGVANRAEAEAQEAASQRLFEHIEGGGRIADLDLETRQLLAGDVLAAARTYERSVLSGEVIETDSQTYVDLSVMAADDPQAFMAANPMMWRPNLSDADFKRFTDMQRSMKTSGPASVSAPSTSSMLSVADAQLRAAGIAKTDDPETYAEFQSDLVRWASENPTDAADPLSLDRRIASMLTPIVLDRRGLMNKFDGRAYQIDYDGDPLDPRDDITAAALLDSTLKINGNTVTPAHIEAFAGTFVARMGRDPSVQEVVEGLIGTGLYN